MDERSVAPSRERAAPRGDRHHMAGEVKGSRTDLLCLWETRVSSPSQRPEVPWVGLQAPSSRRARSSFSVSGLAGEPEEVELWSLPLLPSAEDKRTGHRDCEAGRTCALDMGST